MAIRNLRLIGDDILRKKSREVKEVDERILTLIDDMVETMYENNGMGLAAPQVGVLRRVVVLLNINDDEDEEDELIVLINPVILEKEGSQINEEGCLSVPNRTGFVERPTKMKVIALNEKGEEVIYETDEKLSMVFCHEIDHLDGILYVDKEIEGYEEELEEEIELEKAE